MSLQEQFTLVALMIMATPRMLEAAYPTSAGWSKGEAFAAPWGTVVALRASASPKWILKIRERRAYRLD